MAQYNNLFQPISLRRDAADVRSLLDGSAIRVEASALVTATPSTFRNTTFVLEY